MKILFAFIGLIFLRRIVRFIITIGCIIMGLIALAFDKSDDNGYPL